MTPVHAALITALEAYGPLMALAGADGRLRIYPQVLPQDVKLPAITYKRISETEVRSQDGPSGLVRPRFQLDCWAKTYAEADAVAAAVRDRMDGLRNDDGGNLQGVFADTSRDLYDPALRLQGRSRDFLFWNEE
ncbi:MAG TPA: DUF3168 domain-containing protein [Actinomycetes bacterium]|nr:DUF3168 domain-containing protein [Actinomycetes bacterium]